MSQNWWASTLVGELGQDLVLELRGDSSACHGTLHREGCGKVKHFELKQLWMQSKIRNGELSYIKIPRAQNPADSLAKTWTTDGIAHFSMLSFEAPAAGELASIFWSLCRSRLHGASSSSRALDDSMMVCHRPAAPMNTSVPLLVNSRSRPSCTLRG